VAFLRQIMGAQMGAGFAINRSRRRAGRAGRCMERKHAAGSVNEVPRGSAGQPSGRANLASCRGLVCSEIDGTA
jgi:hypothetical protein